MSNERQVSVSRVIAATPEAVFAVLSDPSMHSTIDGSGMVKGKRFGPDMLHATGEKFGMKMSFKGIPYSITNKVMEYEENELIAWAHFGKHRWRYVLQTVEGGTEVTETFDWSTSASPKLIEMMGYPKQHVGNMEATLERLDAHLTGS